VYILDVLFVVELFNIINNFILLLLFNRLIFHNKATIYIYVRVFISDIEFTIKLSDKQ
jgi:hypothetical protein